MDPIFVTEDHRLRVKRGAVWLDQHRPGWESLIDFATFDIRGSCVCVLGQVFFDPNNPRRSGYSSGLSAAASEVQQAPGANWTMEYGFDAGDVANWTMEYGFDAGDVDMTVEEDYASLQSAWLDLLSERGYHQ